MAPHQLIDYGLALEVLGEIEEAIGCYEEAVRTSPLQPRPRYHLAVAFSRLGRYGESIRAYRELLHGTPDFAVAYNNLANVHLLLGEHSKAGECYRQALAIQPGFSEAHSNLLISLLYAEGPTRKEIFEEHRKWGRRHADPITPVAVDHANDFSRKRRIRLGYVSADLHDSHPLPQFFEPILENHDPDVVETFCYANVAAPDHLTRKLQSLSHQWRNIAGMEDDHFLEQVRRDRIDVLVDLGGHFRGNRLLVFARRPAPVQITYLGYPATTGVRAIGYRLTDEWVDQPGGTDHLHTEELVRLPGGFLCFVPLADAPEVNELPLLHKGRVTFGSFSYRPKITPSAIRLWSAILRRTEGSELLLHRLGDIDNQEVQGQLRAAFATHGIGPERIRFAPGLPRREHLALYNQVDLALDTFPYNGQTTTCEAMSMGVPVVTLAGKTHVSRVGAGLLTVVGLPQFIAQSEDAYVEIASGAVQQPERLAHIRAGLRRRLAQSGLTSARTFTRVLEDTYRSLWDRRCSAIIEESHKAAL